MQKHLVPSIHSNEVKLLQIKDQLKQLKPYQPGKPIEEVKKEYQLDKIVKLASNENPFGCSAHAREAIQAELEHLAIYPDGYSASLRTELAEFLQVNEKQLIFGNGSDELVQIIARAFLDQHTNTVIPKLRLFRNIVTMQSLSGQRFERCRF